MVNTHEALLKEHDAWLHFTDPQQIFQTHQPKEVLPILREIQDLVQQHGWHAAGFLTYEAAQAFDPALLPERRDVQSKGAGIPDAMQDSRLPLLWFALYPPPRLMDLPEPVSAKPALTWLPAVDRATYNAAIERIKSYIADGRTYQVNYTMRLRANFNTDPWNFFLHLAQTQNNYAAYIDLGRYVIASASPELFFQLDGQTITGRPMKGTVKRGRTTREDAEQAQWLKDSEKNRAENVMIVDMIRNDLGRIARVGSVHVPELFATEKYPTLWQMTSTVTAQTDASLAQIFTALFPCASITGAPKVSTMRIISELETTPRGIYTGSIGHIAPNRKATFNVAIRTALIDRETQTAEYGVGGGIVWDSTSTDEYAEALLKARVLTESPPQFNLFETMLWTPEEGFFLRDKHIARLLDSGNYFDFPINPRSSSSPERSGAQSKDVPRPQVARDNLESNQWSRYVSPTNGDTTRPPNQREIIESYLNDIASQFTSASAQRVRLLLDKYGHLTSESKPYAPAESPPLKVCLAQEPVHSGNMFLYHKTTHREVYDSAKRSAGAKPWQEHEEYDDVLLYNERGELTEFTIGNLVVEMDGKLYTPPIACGLLAGTFRGHLLETGQVEERVVQVEELKDCTKMFLVNSVRKWQRVLLEMK